MVTFSRFAPVVFIAFSASVLEAYALNDWNVPCLQGQCAYDLPPSDGTASGTLQIWGSSNAISDITPAAGWSILDCNAATMAQDIRLVCTNSAAGCDHLFNAGVEGKIVRLPQNCGTMPFARVAKSWISEDQSMPSGAGATSNAQVRALSLDMNFAATSPAQYGNVSFAIQASSLPGQDGAINATTVGQQRRFHPRSWTPSPSMAHRRNFITDALNKISSVTDFNKTLTKTLPPIDIDKSANLLNLNKACGANEFTTQPFEASVTIDVDAQVHVVVELGVVAAGSIIPPKLTEVGLFAGLDGNIDGSLTVKADAAGSLDSGTITIFQIGIPGLDFPGILTIGPEFKVQAEATADLQLDIDATVDLSFEIANAKLLFPPSQGKSGGSFKRGDSKLSLSASPTLDANAEFVSKLIPTVDIGINALNGLASASIFLSLDASATLDLTATASGSFEKDIKSGSSKSSSSASAQAQGCVDVKTALSVTAGAQGTLTGLFDDSKNITLFDKGFDLFNKCFDASSSSNSSSNSTSSDSSHSSNGYKSSNDYKLSTSSDSKSTSDYKSSNDKSSSDYQSSSDDKSSSDYTSSSKNESSKEYEPSPSSTTAHKSSSSPTTAHQSKSTSPKMHTSTSTAPAATATKYAAPPSNNGYQQAYGKRANLLCPASPPATSLVDTAIPASQ